MESKFEIINGKWIRVNTDEKFHAIKIDTIVCIEADPKHGTIKLLTMYYNIDKKISGIWLEYKSTEMAQYHKDFNNLKDLLFK